MMLISDGSLSLFLRRRLIVLFVSAAVFVAIGTSAATEEAAAGAGAATTEDASSVSSFAATCDCQPLGPPEEESYIVTRLWTIVSKDWSDQEVIDEFNHGFAPIVTALPGFQRYTAATTATSTTEDGSGATSEGATSDSNNSIPATVFFMNAFDTAEHAAAAQEAAQVFVETNDRLKSAIEPQYFTQDQAIYGFPAGSSSSSSCITEGSVGKFLSTRLYEWTNPENITTDELVVAGSHFNDEIQGLDGYITYVGTLSKPDNRYTFVYNIYETEAVSILANNMGQNNTKTNTVEVPPNTLIVSTQGEIKFDYLCAAGFNFSNSTDEEDDDDDTASAAAASSLVVGSVYDFVAKVFVTNSIVIVSSAIADVLFT